MSGERVLQLELTALIAEVTGLREDKIHLGDRFIEDLGLDSFAAMELLILVEQKYKIKISESDLLRNRTVGDWVKLISERYRRDKATNVSSK